MTANASPTPSADAPRSAREVAAIADPMARVKAAKEALEACRAEMRALAELRAAAVDELLSSGWTGVALARELGVSRPHLYAIGRGSGPATRRRSPLRPGRAEAGGAG